jgi:hypothetical protein
MLASLLDKCIRDRKPANFLIATLRDRPAYLDGIVGNVIVSTLTDAGLDWRGWHAFHCQPAINLHEPGVSDMIIRAILRPSDVAARRECLDKTRRS